MVSLADGAQVPIAEIEVGDVVTCLDEEARSSVDPGLGSPFPDHYGQVDPATWRAVRLRFDEEGQRSTIVELLRPATWLTFTGVALGAMVPLNWRRSRRVNPVPMALDLGVDVSRRQLTPASASLRQRQRPRFHSKASHPAPGLQA